MPPKIEDQAPPSFNWSLNANAAENLAAVDREVVTPLKQVTNQVVRGTVTLSRQLTNKMLLPSDSNDPLLDEDGDEHPPHVDEAAELRKEVEELAKKNNMSRALSSEIATIVERAKALGSPGHGHHDAGPMPWHSMPTVLSRHGEPQPELHIGWADIYLDLILVGVAFNGGLLLKHAFYLCEPHEDFGGWTLDDGTLEGRMLNGHGPKKACVGLGVGVVHALAFATPLLSAWAKETIFDAQFDAASLFSRGVEVLCYLMMVIGASCSEDVDVLEKDNTFWLGLTSSMLVIDLMALLRYGQIAVGHEEDVARWAAWQRIGLIFPGFVLYGVAWFIAAFFIPGSGDDSHGHFVPLIIIAAASAPQYLELLAFLFTSYKRALPYNAGYVLHRSTEIFMVLLGESVLQLITSEQPTHGDDISSQSDLQRKFSCAQLLGFLLSLTAMHSFTIQEPEPDVHVMHKAGSAKGALWMILFLLKSISVWFIGIGIKLALYDVDAPADAFFAHDQKLLLGGSCAACFTLTEMMAPLHTETFGEYFRELLSGKVSVVCFILWMCNIAAMVLVTWLHVSTLESIAIQTGLGVLHMCISHYEVVWLPAQIKRLKAEARAERKKLRDAKASPKSPTRIDYGGD